MQAESKDRTKEPQRMCKPEIRSSVTRSVIYFEIFQNNLCDIMFAPVKV